jgi:hypothetical protein
LRDGVRLREHRDALDPACHHALEKENAGRERDVGRDGTRRNRLNPYPHRPGAPCRFGIDMRGRFLIRSQSCMATRVCNNWGPPMADSRSAAGCQWLVLAHDVSDSVHIDGQSSVAAAFVLDAESGLILGSGVGARSSGAVLDALKSGWQSAVLKRERRQVLCAPDLARVVQRHVAGLAIDAEVVVVDPIQEAEDVFDSLVGHLAGRRQPADLPSPAHWSQLFRQTRAFAEAQPWRSFADDDLLEVELRVGASATSGLCVVLGNAGITRGLALYPHGARPQAIMAGGIPPSGTMCLTLDSRVELPERIVAKARRYHWPEELALWPLFFAWTDEAAADLSAEQTILLTLALAAALSHHQEPRLAHHEGELILAEGKRGRYRVRSLAPTQRASANDGEQLTIERVLREFLTECKLQLAPRTTHMYESVLQLLCACLNSYGHQTLSDDELNDFETAYKAGDEQAFCRLFGPDRIVDNLGEFLGYFMARKVVAGESLLRASGTVTGKLVAWLAERGYLSPADAAEGLQQARAAARNLPRAARLASALFDVAEHGRAVNVNALADEDYLEGELTISRVEPGRLWFDGEIGPVKVPKVVTDLAPTGWMVSLALSRVKGQWRVLQVGTVYPP